MLRLRPQTGALLLEVLIAVTILSVGVLANLRIFSASITASKHIRELNSIRAELDQVFFDWYLDPSGFELADGVVVDSNRKFEKKYRSSIEVQSMTPLEDEEEENSEGENPEKKRQGPNRNQKEKMEFFQVRFAAERLSGKQIYEFHGMVFQYSQTKRR